MRKLRICYDLDGVMYPYSETLREWICHRYSRPRQQMPDARQWNFFLDWGYSLEEYRRLHQEAILDGWLFTQGLPYPGAVDALHQLRAAGHELPIVTDRSLPVDDDPCRPATVAWLRRHDFPYDSLTISADKTAAGRSDLFLEDRPENYDVLDAAGMNPYLITRPWNADHPGRRVASFAEFVAVAERLAATPKPAQAR